MADLFNQQISATYSGLLKTTSNGILSSSLAQITDGRGNGSQLYLSTSKINFYNAYEFPTSDGSANQVLKTDGSGVLTWEDDANTGGVQVSGTPTTNQIAIWTNATTIKGMSALEIDTNDKITLTQGTQNYYIGGGNLANNSGEGNVGLGNDVFKIQTSGNFNIGIGDFAFEDFITGNRNIGIGYASISNSTGTTSNVGVGAATLSYATANNNTALGDSALGNASFTGTQNTAIGYDSGKNITTGSNNVILGSNTGSTIATSSNNIIISDGSGNNRIQVDSGGNVGIGTTPSNDWADSRAIELGANAILWTEQASGQYNSLYMGLNFYVNSSGAKLYKNANVVATRYQQYQGSHTFQTAGTGTPNTSATFVDQLTISSGGDVGIGISPTSKLTLLGTSTAASNTPSDAIVDIKGTSTAHLLMGVANVSPYGAWINTDSTTQPLVLMGTGGNVGIGTDDPQDKLEIKSGYLRMFDPSSDANAGYPIRWASNNGGTNVTYANITGITTSSGNRTGDLVFSTSSGGAPTEKMRISSVGDVAIGSSASKGFLNSTGTAFELDVNRNPNTGIFGDTNKSHARIEMNGASGGSSILFKTASANNTTATTKLTISSGGAATFSSSAAIAGGLAVGTGTQFATSIFFASAVLSAGAGTYPLKWNSSTGIVTYDTSSRLVKKNIQDSPYGLPQVLQLQPRKYFRTDDKKEEIGFIADEIQKILPEFVPMVEKSLFTKNEEDIELIPGGVNYEKLTAVLVKAIQEQQTIIEDLKARIETLEG